MLYILISLIVAGCISFVLFFWAADGYDGRHIVAGIAGIVLAIATGVTAVTYCFAAWSWMAADSKAKIINREYGTNYTREEVFFAHDVIDTIREIDRKRVEVNGDIMRDEPDK